MAPFRAALAGCGHMGRHHARTVHQHPDWVLAAVVDPNRPRAEHIAAQTGARVLDAVPDDVDAVIVACTTSAHLEVAAPVLDRGQWCLVEKPVTDRSSDAARLSGPRLVVGQSERFNPAVRALGGLPEAAVIEATRTGPTTPRCAQSDVVIDRMIHDLDLLGHWGLPLEAAEFVRCEGARVEGRWVEARVELVLGGVRVRLHSARHAAPEAPRVRQVLLRGAALYELDLLAGTARGPRGPIAPVDGRDALTAQWQGFTEAVRGAPTQVTTGAEGFRALAFAERIGAALVETACA